MTEVTEAYQKIVENMHDGLYFTDRRRVITYWNKAAERISGFSAEEVMGRSCADNILTHIDKDGNHLCRGLCPLAKTMQDGTPREAEVYLHHKDGHRVPVMVRVTPLYDDDGEIVGGIELFTDISSQEANHLRMKELERLALLDRLTQLANRVYLESELESRMNDFKSMNVPFGFLFMDIDHFKKFNDTYGHDVGDEVLKFIARTFVTNARPFDVFGRWGGEEFVGVIRNVRPDELQEIAERLCHTVANSYLMHEEQKLSVTISIGASLVKAGDSIDSLVKRADTLLYESKANGRNRVTLG